MPAQLHRRRFLKAAGAAGAAALVLNDSRAARAYYANEKLDVALVGVGGRGRWFVDTMPRIGENVVAMCDVNGHRAAESFKKLPRVPKYRDFRQLLDEKDKQLDAVVIATPDNTHAVIAAAAMRRGKHVYCEKPLTHDVAEARALREIAKQEGVVTQMGNQGTATEAFRRAVELIQAESIGPIQEVHVWNTGGGGPRPLPKGSEPVPDWLAWDLWLGPAAERPFHPAWLKWHTWRDFATGKLGNWGSHSANLAFKGLKVDTLWYADAGSAPRLKFRAKVAEPCPHTFPKWELIEYKIPARAGLRPITITWCNGSPEGRKRIEAHLGRRLDWGDAGEKRWKEHGGCLVVGSEGMIKSTEHNSSFTLLPEDKYRDFEGPAKTLPRSGSHEREWVRACKGGAPTMSNFDYAGPLAEFLLLGNVATQFDAELEFDPRACKIVNHARADAALRREYRKGWSL